MTRYLPGGGHAGERLPGALRVFCFPYAGGAASTYARWQRLLGLEVEVLPVQLPGREGRMAEKRFTNLPALVDELDRELGPELEHPHVLFGHSMGALIAFALAERRLIQGSRPAEAVLLSAYRAPHLPPPEFAAPDATEHELVESLVRLGGIPQVLLDHPDWLSALLPIARDDLLMCSGPGPSGTVPLPMPVHTFAGTEDLLVTPDEVRQWDRYAEGDFGMRMVPGGHFFIRESEQEFLVELRDILGGLTERRFALI
ncbi:Oxidoreductase [Kitasatospora sp. MMS16-BH015]|uniref:thioesterase II family protein n=1 Tax=Kitasatospora sp. MMS16-BH015 TaxID=2018025 RepID=UPI000CA2C759|nr:alpha/beta fold hydrolase [Kitasatospora sp. MMS16-BH015]AUG78791.1 Oxidoreductase [Kitasatospora sp. MMS16-BH015]